MKSLFYSPFFIPDTSIPGLCLKTFKPIRRQYWKLWSYGFIKKEQRMVWKWLLRSVEYNSWSTKDKTPWISSWNLLGRKSGNSPINLRLLRLCSWNDCLALLSVFLADICRRDDSKANSVCLSSQGLELSNQVKLHKPIATLSSGNSASSSSTDTCTHV